MPLALPTPTVNRKRHESAMSSAMNRVRGRGGSNGLLPQANVRARKDALTPVRLLRSNSLRIPWVLMASWARLLVIWHMEPFRAKTNDRPIGQISPISVRDLHIMSAEFPKTVCDNLHGERVLHLPPVVLLKTLGKCAGFRAKYAHISGHLPEVIEFCCARNAARQGKIRH